MWNWTGQRTLCSVTSWSNLMVNKSFPLSVESLNPQFLDQELQTSVEEILTGTEKRTLTVIRQSKHQRHFKNIKMFPVNYLYSKKVWMTSELFETELRWLEQKWKILLLVDNCSAHPHMKNLQRIQLLFLVPNCTSKL